MQQLFFFLLFSLISLLEAADPLPSWNDGETKNRIIEFVNSVTQIQSPTFVPAEDRIATFDQDGTLWVEQPFYTQLFFALDRLEALSREHPEWTREEPYRTILSKNLEQMKNLSEIDIEKIVAATHAGITLQEFHAIVQDWIKKAVHPKYKRPFTELTYLPMLELMHFLESNGFKNYIVSGGGQEFMRVFTKETYGLSPDKVIGTTEATQYEYNEGKPVLRKIAKIVLIDDEQGKPENINLFIGKKPIAAFGNSTGDQQMLEWSASNANKSLQLLVHHDDAEREYAYGADSKIGTFSDELMQEAKSHGWLVVSMKNDWKKIFNWEK